MSRTMALARGACMLAYVGTASFAQQPPPSAPSAPAPAASPRWLAPDFSARVLLEEPLPLPWRHGLALQHAAAGQLAPAAAELPTDDPLCERDRMRLEALVAARIAFFGQLEKEGRKVKFELVDGAATGTVRAVDAAGFDVVDAKGNARTVAWRQLPLELLLRKATEQKLPLGTDATPAYAQLLAGRKTWKKAAGGGTHAEADLLADGDTLVERLAFGASALRLERLAACPAEPRTDVATALLADVKALLADPIATAVVAARREALRDVAARLLAVKFAEDPLAHLGLVAKAERLPEGRLRLHYDWRDPKQGEDWRRVTPVWPQDWGSFPPLKSPVEKHGHAVGKAGLAARGAILLALPVPLMAPLRVTATVEHRSEDLPDWPINGFRLAICSDATSSRMIHTMEMGGLAFVDKPTHGYREDYEMQLYSLDEPYTMELAHDGQRVTLTSPQRPSRQLAVPELTRGEVRLFFYCDREIVVRDLVVEGRFDPAGVGPRMVPWIEAELAKLEAGRR